MGSRGWESQIGTRHAYGRRVPMQASTPTPHSLLPTPQPAIVPRRGIPWTCTTPPPPFRQPIYSPTPVPVEQFIDGIRELSRASSPSRRSTTFSPTYEIRAEDLERYKHVAARPPHAQQSLPQRHDRGDGDLLADRHDHAAAHAQRAARLDDDDRGKTDRRELQARSTATVPRTSRSWAWTAWPAPRASTCSTSARELASPAVR